MTATLIGHDDLGFQVWQDPQTKRVVGGITDAEQATRHLSQAACFTLENYQKEFGFTPLEGA